VQQKLMQNAVFTAERAGKR